MDKTEFLKDAEKVFIENSSIVYMTNSRTVYPEQLGKLLEKLWEMKIGFQKTGVKEALVKLLVKKSFTSKQEEADAILQLLV